jgi:hypothetical protein
MKAAYFLGFSALLFVARAGAADDVRAWQTWLAAPAATSLPTHAGLPSERELGVLRSNKAWLARWAVPPPSVAWNDVAAELVVKYQQTPLRATRTFAYVHTAIHDALVQCARLGCESHARLVAMHAAASRMLDHLYPDESRGRMEALGHSAAAAVLTTGASRQQAELAWSAGRAVAENAIRRALDDGWDLPRLPLQRPAWKPGLWRASPPLNVYDPQEPNAPRWRTWVLKNSAEIEAPPPPAYGTPAYWADVDEVRAVGAALTAEQKRIADDWNLGAGSVTPPGVWNLRAKDLVLAQKLDAAQAARVFSALNVAMADAMIACWHAKYRWWIERPVTVIRDHRDPAFNPYLFTPPHPSYISGHSSASGAGEGVLAAFFPGEAPKLNAMAEEAAMSRLYGGIHFRSDNEQGLVLGRKVAARVLAHMGEAPGAQFTGASAATTR